VRIEAKYGSRTTLDLLDAEQEYLDAQVAHVTAERDKVVALYRLLSSIGALTAARLGLDVPMYNPEANFQKVKNRWIGTSIDD
jgi:outer membrane protein